MENHGLGTLNDKMWADRSIGNIPNTLQIYSAHLHKLAIIWDIFEKRFHHMSIVHASNYRIRALYLLLNHAVRRMNE